MNKTLTAADGWQSTLDAMQDSVWLLDADRRIMRCNKASCELFGKSLDDMIARLCCDIVHGAVEPIFECPMNRMQSGDDCENEKETTDGRSLFVRGYPLANENGDAVIVSIETGEGLGLFGLGERLRDMGGTLEIESEPNDQTRVSLHVSRKDG